MDLSLLYKQSDAVLISTFIIMLIMSITTWSIIIWRAWHLIKAKKTYAKQMRLFWQAADLYTAQSYLKNSYSPLAQITSAAIQLKNAQTNTHNLSHQVPFSESLLRHIRHTMKQAMRPFTGGLSTLASIGATAPFVGLFGTVWGIYHALINIGKAGQMTIAAVAGPIGEALVATAAGLFVAIPAVLAYNTFVRSNKTLFDDIEGFAHDLYIQLINAKD